MREKAKTFTQKKKVQKKVTEGLIPWRRRVAGAPILSHVPIQMTTSQFQPPYPQHLVCISTVPYFVD